MWLADDVLGAQGVESSARSNFQRFSHDPFLLIMRDKCEEREGANPVPTRLVSGRSQTSEPVPITPITLSPTLSHLLLATIYLESL